MSGVAPPHLLSGWTVRGTILTGDRLPYGCPLIYRKYLCCFLVEYMLTYILLGEYSILPYQVMVNSACPPCPLYTLMRFDKLGYTPPASLNCASLQVLTRRVRGSYLRKEARKWGSAARVDVYGALVGSCLM